MIRRGMALLAAWCVALPVMAQPSGYSARAWVDSTTFTVGDPILLHILVTHPHGEIPRVVVGDSLGPLSVLQRGQATEVNDSTTGSALVLAYYDSGAVVIPSVQVVCKTASDSAAFIGTNPVTVTVHTMAVDTTKEYRDLKPPMRIPLSWAEIALFAGIILAVAALGYAGYRWWKKRKQAPAKEAEAVPARPADVLALEELGALKDRRLWQQGMVKEYYSELTEIVRRYFERRYNVHALEETTDEILEALQRVKVAEKPLRTAETLLVRADLVKFAKFLPGIPEHEESMDLASAVVEQTRLITQPQRIPSAQPVTERANVGN